MLPICPWKGKKIFLLPVAFFSYFEYACVFSRFYNGFNNWIIHVVWNRIAVSIFCNFKSTYNIGKEMICAVLKSLQAILKKVSFSSFDTILSDKNNGLPKVAFCNFFSFIKITLMLLFAFLTKGTQLLCCCEHSRLL